MTEQRWNQEFAKKLRYKLDSQGIDQRRLSNLSGISEAAISRYLAGTQTPKVYALTQIAKALNSSLYELIPFER